MANLVFNGIGNVRNDFNMLYGHFEDCDCITKFKSIEECSRYPHCPTSHLEYFDMKVYPRYDNNLNRYLAYDHLTECVPIKTILTSKMILPEIDKFGNLPPNVCATNKEDQAPTFFKVIYKTKKSIDLDEDESEESPKKKRKMEKEASDGSNFFLDACPIAFSKDKNNLDNPAFDDDFSKFENVNGEEMGVYEFSWVDGFNVESAQDFPQEANRIKGNNFLVINRICNHNLFFVEQAMLNFEYSKMEQEKRHAVSGTEKGFVESMVCHYEKHKNLNNYLNKYELFYSILNGNLRIDSLLNRWADEHIDLLVQNLELLKSHPTLKENPSYDHYLLVGFSWRDICLRRQIDPWNATDKEIAKVLFVWLSSYGFVEYKSYHQLMGTKIFHNLTNFSFRFNHSTKDMDPLKIRLIWHLTNSIQFVWYLERNYPQLGRTQIYSLTY